MYIGCVTVVAVHGGRCVVREGSKLGQGCCCLHQAQKLVRNHFFVILNCMTIYVCHVRFVVYPLISTEIFVTQTIGILMK